ncbi:MAG: DJ-1/PfpI family protein, partial [Candidatus Omnitrophota bacterium]
MQKKAIVLLAEGFEEIEAITIIDVLRRSGVGVDACGIDSLRVKGSRGINVFADIILKNVTGIYDACALPGGMPGAANLFADKRIRGMLLTQAKTDSGLIAAICSSPAVVLAPLGILDNKSATCYPGM